MKKLLLIVLSIVFVLGFIAADYAAAVEQTDITLSGSIRTRGEMRVNVNDFDDSASNTGDSSAYDTRVRLQVDVKTSPNTSGRIEIESGDCTSSEAASTNVTDVYTWGTCGSEGLGVYGEGNGKRGTLNIRQAWIQHEGSGLLGVPSSIRIGHMPFILGNGLFLNHSKYGDDLIVVTIEATKELGITLVNAKATEGTTGTPDDTDAYVVAFTYTGVDSIDIDGDITFINDQNYSAHGLHVWNFGLRGATVINDINLRADVEIQSGKAKGALGAAAATATNIVSDAKFRGYAFLIAADMAIDQVTYDAAIAYGSGDSDRSDDTVDTFLTAQHGSQKFTYVYDYRTATAGVTAPALNAGGTGAAGTGIANTYYLKIGALANPLKDMTAKVDLYLLRASQSTSNINSSKSIGTEIDAKITYDIEKNLVYYVEGGYLWAGNFYKNVAASASNPDNAYSVRHGIMLTF